MILQKITLNPFAGLSNITIEFHRSLNVILGKNEAGKSTIYHAIENVLFRPSKLRKNIFEKEMQRFIPIGGDNAGVHLVFIAQEKTYQLYRRWRSKNPEAEFILPDGSSISDDESIRQKLQELLPAPEGTCKAILMSYQTGLSKTLDDIKLSDGSSLRDLDDILRGAVLESDGISVARFQEMLQQQYNDYFNKWDIRADEPEGGKGIENPWKRGAGTIVECFYEKEKIAQKLKNAKHYEDEYDRILTEISKLKEEARSEREYLDEHRRAYDDSRERTTIESAILKIDSQREKLNEANRRWPVTEAEIANLKSRIPEIENEIGRLKTEKDQADKAKQNRKYIEKYNRARKRKEETDEADRSLRKIIKITSEQIRKLEKLDRNIGELKIQIEAGKLKLNLLARKDITLQIHKGVDDPEQISVAAGKSGTIESGATLKLEHKDWAMNIVSGEEDIEGIITRYNGLRDEYGSILESCGAGSLSDAKEKNKNYEELNRKYQNAVNNLEAELEGDTYDDLEAKVRNIGETGNVREPEVIVRELTTREHEHKKVRNDLREREERVAEYTELYKDQDSLHERLGSILHERKQFETRLENLAPVPGGMSNDEFLKEYDDRRENLQSDINEKIKALDLDKAGLEGRAPDRSVEEIEKEYREAERMFRSELRKGLAVKKIRDTAAEIITGLDTELYGDLKNNVEGYIAGMTANRYTRIEMEINVPSGFRREDGKILPADYLSVGTKDVLGLSLRLSMAKFFLKETDGFLIMDDPLVDLDPERQELAAKAIIEFSADKQVLVFTCHPGHAEMLGGKSIELGGEVY